MSVGFELPGVLEVHALAHPDERVRRVGFSLEHPYVEQCWAGVLGPSSMLVLRRMPVLWREEMPARVDVRELALSIGLGTATTGQQSRIVRTFDRLRKFGMLVGLDEASVGVYAHVPPVPQRLLKRVPDWTVRVHERLVQAHLEELAGGPPAPAVDGVRARLDHLQRTAGPRTLGTPA
jgi:hypothetical protein